MDTTHVQYVLESLHFTSPLPDDIRGQLAAACLLREVRAGAIIFREGDITDTLYLVHTGRVVLEMNSPARGGVRILTVGEGDMFGWSSLMEGGKMTTSAVAQEDCEIVVASAERLRTLAASDAQFGYHLMKRMAEALSRRLVATRLQSMDLFALETPPIPTARHEGSS